MSSFQAAFAQALFAPAAPDHAAVRELLAQPAFAIYRNTVMKGCIDALEANFPAVLRLVGSAWFRSAAAEYVRTSPPVQGCLLAYGDDGFAAFLAALPATAELTYLPGVAQLDTLWRAAHVAADAPVLDAALLAADRAEELAQRVLRPHPATRWAWFDAQPVVSIWSRNRPGGDDAGALAWHGEGLLFTRPEGAVHWEPLSRAGCALLDACSEGAALGAAVEHALQADSQADVPALLRQLLLAPAFTASTIHSFGEAS